MARTRKALIRYRTLDRCLRTRGKKWSREELIDACTEAIREGEKKEKPVALRTLNRDIAHLRSYYEAPIVVLENKYYTYADKSFSITNSPLDGEDLQTLQESLGILRQFEGFDQIQELAAIISKIEDRISYLSPEVETIIDHEAVMILQGREHLGTMYEFILRKQAMEITYQSFKDKNPTKYLISPHYLKAYNGRWYVLGTNHALHQLSIYALDRTHQVNSSLTSYLPNRFGAPKFYFEQVIGVSVPQDQAVEEILLQFVPRDAPYIKSRPWHPSQEVIQEDEAGVTIRLALIPNYELESKILSFGKGVVVLAPNSLREKIKGILVAAAAKYE